MQEKQIARDLAIRLSVYCSARVLKQVHAAFDMTQDGGNYVGFAKFCLKIHEKYFDHEEESWDEYPELENKWDTAMLEEVEKHRAGTLT